MNLELTSLTLGLRGGGFGGFGPRVACSCFIITDYSFICSHSCDLFDFISKYPPD